MISCGIGHGTWPDPAACQRWSISVSEISSTARTRRRSHGPPCSNAPGGCGRRPRHSCGRWSPRCSCRRTVPSAGGPLTDRPGANATEAGPLHAVSGSARDGDSWPSQWSDACRCANPTCERARREAPVSRVTAQELWVTPELARGVKRPDDRCGASPKPVRPNPYGHEGIEVLRHATEAERKWGFWEEVGRGERIRTSDPSVPNRVLYQAEPRPDNLTILPYLGLLRRGSSQGVQRSPALVRDSPSPSGSALARALSRGRPSASRRLSCACAVRSGCSGVTATSPFTTAW